MSVSQQVTKEPQAQLGYMLQALNEKLVSIVPKKCHKDMKCWMEDVELKLAPKHHGHGLDIGRMEYTAVFSFERFPFNEFNPAIVYAVVMGWLQDHDSLREQFELDDPISDVEPDSDTTAIMTIEIDFVEPISVVESPNGLIEWRSKRYELAPYEIWIAEHCTLLVGNDSVTVPLNA